MPPTLHGAARIATWGSAESFESVEVAVSVEDALDADHRLYAPLGLERGNDARRCYNLLLRELVSFERTFVSRHERLQKLR
jgi:hypothetical protein